jgi:hypothetical protein
MKRKRQGPYLVPGTLLSLVVQIQTLDLDLGGLQRVAFPSIARPSQSLEKGWILAVSMGWLSLTPPLLARPIISLYLAQLFIERKPVADYGAGYLAS